jgi:hypothetical protein
MHQCGERGFESGSLGHTVHLKGAGEYIMFRLRLSIFIPDSEA